MKAIKIIIIVLSLALSSSCSDTNKSEDEYGYVLFYTDAQFMLNCGQFDVRVAVNDDKVGCLQFPFLPIDSIPNCNNVDSLTTLILEMKPGRYDYRGDCECGTEYSWNGEFRIYQGECTKVKLSLANGDEVQHEKD